MSEIKSLIDSNDAANAYYRYMRSARRDGSKMPTRVHTDPQAKMLVRELNNELDKLQFGYSQYPEATSSDFCIKCGEPLFDDKRKHYRLIRSIYPNNGGRIDFYECERCKL